MTPHPTAPHRLAALSVAGSLVLAACFKPTEDLAVLDFTEVPFDNGLVASADAVVRTYETSLPCPDGEPARFYLVYRKDQVGPAPVAVVFHSGAFDFELDPAATAGSTLDGVTWRGDSRLVRDWADKAVWETLGMYRSTVVESEQHLGALPAALVDAGVVGLYPANCWGDLWHNESGFQDNAFSYETFSRNGRTFAWWMIRILTEENFDAGTFAEFPFESNGQLYLVGLGDGGRGAVELLLHDGMPAVDGVLLDSTPDTLSAYLDPTLELSAEAEGLSRLWPEALDLAEIDDWSILGMVQGGAQPPAPTTAPGDTGASGDTGVPGDTGGTPPGGDTGDDADPPDAEEEPETGGIDDLSAYALPRRIALVWSQADPQQPRAATEATAAALASREDAWVVDTEARGHVFSNAAPGAAGPLVEFLLTGTRGELDWTVPVDDDTAAAAAAADGTARTGGARP